MTRLGPRRTRSPVQFRCSHCHHRFAGEGDQPPSACPNCGVEAGLEAHAGAPLAMKLFGMLVVLVIVASVAGAVVSVLAS